MIQSMTGYGKATLNFNNKKIIAEIKALNSKQMDLNIRISNLYREKDIDIRNIIAQSLIRGKVDVALYIEDSTTAVASHINTALVKDYYNQLLELSSSIGLPISENILSTLLTMPDVMRSESATLSDEEWDAVKTLLNNALDQIISFRRQEGEALYTMFVKKIQNISLLLEDIEKYEPERVAKIRSRIEENLHTIEDRIAIDKNRLEQEMIYYIEKLDINEEKVRLRNHLKYFIQTMNTEATPGKKLGFIAQEIGREINTMGSKSNHGEMQCIVVKMKDELEQIKEQVLNVL